jgi:predicted ATPase
MACFRFQFTLGHLCLVIRLVTMRVAMGVLEATLEGSAAPGAAATYATAQSKPATAAYATA